jgi:hypothetical protein
VREHLVPYSAAPDGSLEKFGEHLTEISRRANAGDPVAQKMLEQLDDASEFDDCA